MSDRASDLAEIRAGLRRWPAKPMTDHIPADNVRSLLGEQLCKALGLDGSRITRLEIVIDAGNIPVLTVTRALFGNDCGGPFTQVFQQYQLTPIASAPKADDQDSTGSN